MKRIILSAVVVLSLASCRHMLPTYYTLWSNQYHRIFSYYGPDSLKVGQSVVVDGERMDIVGKY